MNAKEIFEELKKYILCNCEEITCLLDNSKGTFFKNDFNPEKLIDKVNELEKRLDK